MGPDVTETWTLLYEWADSMFPRARYYQYHKGGTSNCVECSDSVMSRCMNKNVNQCGGFRCRVSVALATLQHAHGSHVEAIEMVCAAFKLPMTDVAREHFRREDFESARSRAHKQRKDVIADRYFKKKTDKHQGYLPRRVYLATVDHFSELPDNRHILTKLNTLQAKIVLV